MPPPADPSPETSPPNAGAPVAGVNVGTPPRAGRWSLPVAGAAFLIAFAFQLYTTWKHCGGEFVYALDDAYIHLGTARSFVQDGVWGFTPEGFSGLSSSPLWVLALSAGWLLFGGWTLLPLALNLVGAFLLLAAVHRLWAEEKLPDAWSAVGLTLLALAAPLVALVVSGMEHVWHHLRLAAVAADGAPAAGAVGIGLPDRGAAGGLLLLAPRRRITGLLLPLVGASLISAFGLWSMGQGGTFLPNSIVLKSNQGGLNPLNWFGAAQSARLLGLLWSCPELSVGALWIVALLFRASEIQDDRRRRRLSEGAVLLVGIAAQLLLADVGWLFRYEAYLVTLMLVYGVPRTQEAWSAPADVSTLGLSACRIVAPAAAAAFLLRLATAAHYTGLAPANIYEQQLQAARFLSTYPAGDVALVDVGAAAYFNPKLRILDMVGLATQQVADLRRAKAYNPAALDALVRRRGTTIAVYCDDYAKTFGPPPPRWVKVGSWTIAQQVVVYGKTLSFYALDAAEAPRLIERLRAYSEALPETVKQSGLYTRPGPPDELLTKPRGGNEPAAR